MERQGSWTMASYFDLQSPCPAPWGKQGMERSEPLRQNPWTFEFTSHDHRYCSIDDHENTYHSHSHSWAQNSGCHLTILLDVFKERTLHSVRQPKPNRLQNDTVDLWGRSLDMLRAFSTDQKMIFSVQSPGTPYTDPHALWNMTPTISPQHFQIELQYSRNPANSCKISQALAADSSCDRWNVTHDHVIRYFHS